MFELTEMNFLYIINIVLVIAVIYILFFKKTAENFESVSLNDVKNEINNKYSSDIDAIRNLASISKQIMKIPII